MNKKSLLIAALAFAVSAAASLGIAKAAIEPAIPQGLANETPDLSLLFDGVCFDVRNVTETFVYNDTACYMVYDDIDAGIDYEIIRVSKETYDKILKAQEESQPLTGTLKAVKPYESVEYFLEPDERFNLQ